MAAYKLILIYKLIPAHKLSHIVYRPLLFLNSFEDCKAWIFIIFSLKPQELEKYFIDIEIEDFHVIKGSGMLRL